MSLLTLSGLFERVRAPSQSKKGHFSKKMKLKKWHQNSWHWQKSAQYIRDVSWHLSKRGSELEKRWPFSILDKNGAHKNKAWYSSTSICACVNSLDLMVKMTDSSLTSGPTVHLMRVHLSGSHCISSMNSRWVARLYRLLCMKQKFFSTRRQKLNWVHNAA